LLLFDGPATAVRASLEHLRGVARVGVSIAEVPREAETIEAYGVLLAVELADAAPPCSLRVSATVGALLSGSGVRVEPAGTRMDGDPVLHAVLA
jgi:hypothetical protein